ncbi:lysylphosphatidylglycerol synthase transmembrane domain-containing protein [Ilumatobacter sp.]|uniref:lysylphosphatidylglycerol synthase transmembrane domain-containing protein n=1 Tax=Ilumatobacter sp. TaxID=1967498 RepID=UPI003AF80AAF
MTNPGDQSEAPTAVDTDDGAVAVPQSIRPKTKQIVIAVGVTAAILIVVFGFLLPSIVSYDDIWTALREIEPWQFGVLLLLWIVKLAPEGLVYARSIPGMAVSRGSAAWTASTAFSNVVPGPGDLLVRLSMYSTWGFGVDRAMISMTVSGIFQNVNRLTLPVIGVVWYAASRSTGDGDVEGWLVVLAAIALVILVAGIVFGVMVIRSEPLARRVGDFLSRIVGWASRKLKRDAPVDLTDRLLGWRDDARDLIVERWWQLWLTHFSTTVLNVVMLLAAVRYAGAGSDELTLPEVFLAYALVQLVTIIPITNGNIGIAEIAYIAFLTAFTSGGETITGAIAAGVIVFRLYNWLLVIPVGFVTTAVWRSQWRKKLGYDPFTILAVKYGSRGASAA